MTLIFLGFAKGAEQTFFSMDISWIPGFHDLSVSWLDLQFFLLDSSRSLSLAFGGTICRMFIPCTCEAQEKALLLTLEVE